MARIKRSGFKSTGGKAVRKPLPVVDTMLHRASRPPPPRARKTNDEDDYMLSLMSSDPHSPIATTSVAEILAESSNAMTSVQMRSSKSMAGKGLSNTDEEVSHSCF